MAPPPTVQELTGRRLHLSHGPIDVVLKAWGPQEEVRAAYAAAGRRFPAILPELCDELTQLRTPMDQAPCVDGPVARRMLAACRPFADDFLTPMAAVAGAVADELLAHMLGAGRIARAFVNDGGDIAIHMAPGEAMEVGVAGDFEGGGIPALNGRLRLDGHTGVGGVATSGARGRSLSLGIADSVTVLASCAALADAAATLIANAVDVASPAIARTPAHALDPDSDLGDRLVTVGVGALSAAEIGLALDRGAARALSYRARGLIVDAALMLQGAARTLAPAAAASPGPAGQPPGSLAAPRPGRQPDRDSGTSHTRETRRRAP
ncbi:MAG: UPF0280 family protein [Hyphomicrobiaceae bacterium]|nr:UPF0280 family protein [Hyphomicrobiaceae bacterium]